MSSNDLLLIIFGIILIFVLKKIFSIFKTRKKLTGEISTIKLRGRNTLLILSIALVVFGIIYFFSIKDFYSIIYVLIGICYSVVSTDRLYVGTNGFCFDGKFAEFKKIKKWRAINNKFYEVVISGDLKDEILTIPLDKENSEKISNFIKINKVKSKVKK